MQLPVRPNGVTGFVRAGAVDVGKVRTRIRVDVSARRLTLFRNGRPVLRTVGRRRLARHADADRQLLRQPAAHPGEHVGPVRPRRARDLRLLERPPQLGAGRPGRDPRHERAVVDRPRGLERLHPRAQPRAPAAVRRDAGRDPGHDHRVTRRARIVFVAAVLTAGLAATLAALAGSPSPPAPDPQEAILDGCGRNYIDQTQRLIPTWVYVGDRNAPASGPPPPTQRLEGVISSRYVPDLAVHPTEEDLPPIHRAYDFNFDVLPDAAYTGLLGGDPAQHTGNYAGTSPRPGACTSSASRPRSRASRGPRRATASRSSAPGSGTAATGRRRASAPRSTRTARCGSRGAEARRRRSARAARARAISTSRATRPTRASRRTARTRRRATASPSRAASRPRAGGRTSAARTPSRCASRRGRPGAPG